MNILILISSLEFGGAEKQAVTDANLLSETNKVWIITFKDGPQKKFISNNVSHFVIKKSGYIKTALLLRKIIVENKIDVIHSSLFAASIISSFASVLTKVSVVWHFHSHEYDVPWYSKAAFIICARLPNVKNIFFVNTELKNDLATRFLLPKHKLNILYNSGSFQFTQNNYSAGLKPIIGFVGRLVELKRVDLLTDLADYLIKHNYKDFEIRIIGDGEERNRLENCVRGKKLDEFVKFYGFQENTSEYYSSFSIFILPSREECLSIALIDAGSAGVPSIAFDVGGNNEIIDNGTTGFIVRSKEELFEKTILLLKDQVLRINFSKNSIIFCADKFSKEVRKRKLIKITEDVVKI